MNCGRLTVIMMVILFSVSTYAANAFLDAPNNQPASAKFRGTEWSPFRHKMFADQSFVLDDCSFERLKNHPLLAK